MRDDVEANVLLRVVSTKAVALQSISGFDTVDEILAYYTEIWASAIDEIYFQSRAECAELGAPPPGRIDLVSLWNEELRSTKTDTVAAAIKFLTKIRTEHEGLRFNVKDFSKVRCGDRVTARTVAPDEITEIYTTIVKLLHNPDVAIWYQSSAKGMGTTGHRVGNRAAAEGLTLMKEAFALINHTLSTHCFDTPEQIYEFLHHYNKSHLTHALFNELYPGEGSCAYVCVFYIA